MKRRENRLSKLTWKPALKSAAASWAICSLNQLKNDLFKPSKCFANCCFLLFFWMEIILRAPRVFGVALCWWTKIIKRTIQLLSNAGAYRKFTRLRKRRALIETLVLFLRQLTVFSSSLHDSKFTIEKVTQIYETTHTTECTPYEGIVDLPLNASCSFSLAKA